MTFETFLLFVAIATVVVFLLFLAGFVFFWIRQDRSYREFMERRKGADHRYDPKQFRGRR